MSCPRRTIRVLAKDYQNRPAPKGRSLPASTVAT